MSSTDLLQNQLLKNLLGITSECQTVWIRIRVDVSSGPIWVETVSGGHCQMTLVDKEVFIVFYYKVLMLRSRGGVPPPPEKSENIGFSCNTGPDPLKKSQSYQASIHINGVSLAGRSLPAK